MNNPNDAAVAGSMLFIGVIVAIFIIVAVLANIKIFNKAGEAGWKSLVPILNIFVFLKIIRQPAWRIILYFIPLVNIIVSLIDLNRFCKSFGKGFGFLIGMLFLQPIFMLILAFGDAEYNDAVLA